MAKFPLHFDAEGRTEAGISTLWKSGCNGLEPISCSIPTEFSGPGGGYSPEDLFALALLNCLIATFKVYAEKSNVQFKHLHAKTRATMDKDRTTNQMTVTQLHTEFNITGASDAEKLRKLLDKAIQDCAISNSIKSGKTYSIYIE